MKFSPFIQELKEQTDDSYTFERSLKNRIQLPENVSVDSISFGKLGLGKRNGPPYLGLTLFFGNMRKFPSLMDYTLASIKDLSFSEGDATFNYSLNWSLEEFLKLRELPSFHDLKISSSFTRIDPRKKRFQVYRHPEWITAEVDENSELSLSVRGRSRKHLEHLIRDFDFQAAHITLSTADAKRLFKEVRRDVEDFYSAEHLRRVVQPNEAFYIDLRSGDIGVVSDSAEPELVVPIRLLKRYEDLLGKPLLGIPYFQQTRVSSIKRKYDHPYQLLTHLQELARVIPVLHSDTDYKTNLLSGDQARNFLDREFAFIETAYKKDDFYVSDEAKSMLETLGQDRLGREVIEKLYVPDETVHPASSNQRDTFSLDDYISLLKDRGYHQTSSFEAHPATLKYALWAVKSRYLFEFLKQIYSQEPAPFVENIIGAYRHSKPDFTIETDSGDQDISRFSVLSFPRGVELSQFDLRGELQNGYLNRLSFRRCRPDATCGDAFFVDTSTLFRSRNFLHLQEKVYERLGIEF